MLSDAEGGVLQSGNRTHEYSFEPNLKVLRQAMMIDELGKECVLRLRVA